MHISYVGGLGRDAEIKVSKSGNQFLSFSVACDEMVRGEKKTIWTNVTYMPNDSSKLAQYLKKGKRVFINGNLNCDLYTAKDNSVNISYNVMADSVEFIGGTASGETASTTTATTTVTTPTPQPNISMGTFTKPEPMPTMATSAVNDGDSDLPF